MSDNSDKLGGIKDALDQNGFLADRKVAVALSVPVSVQDALDNIVNYLEVDESKDFVASDYAENHATGWRRWRFREPLAPAEPDRPA